MLSEPLQCKWPQIQMQAARQYLLMTQFKMYQAQTVLTRRAKLLWDAL